MGLPRNCSSKAVKEKKKKRKDYAFQRQFNEKPDIIPGCPGQEGSACCQLKRPEENLPDREAAVALETSLRCVLYAAASLPASVCHAPAAALATLSPAAVTADVQQLCNTCSENITFPSFTKHTLYRGSCMVQSGAVVQAEHCAVTQPRHPNPAKTT